MKPRSLPRTCARNECAEWTNKFADANPDFVGSSAPQERISAPRRTDLLKRAELISHVMLPPGPHLPRRAPFGGHD